MTDEQQQNTTAELIRHLTPVVHLNGTSGEDLYDQWRRFDEALQNNFPTLHDRDYYVKGEEFAHSRAARQVLREKVAKVLELVEGVQQGIADQVF